MSSFPSRFSALFLTVMFAGPVACNASDAGVAVPSPIVDAALTTAKTEQTAVFAGGCFWGIQNVFEHVKGVTHVTSGFAGGRSETAEYEVVSRGTTGHAESVRIVFDPAVVSYATLLKVFFVVAHDPTELNRQGPDTGTQYRSAIFPANTAQADAARAYIAQIDQAHVFKKAVVTKIEPNATFYPAEAYHQDFLTRNPTYPYIAINDLPKIEDLKRLFPDRYHAAPMLVAGMHSPK